MQSAVLHSSFTVSFPRLHMPQCPLHQRTAAKLSHMCVWKLCISCLTVDKVSWLQGRGCCLIIGCLTYCCLSIVYNQLYIFFWRRSPRLALDTCTCSNHSKKHTHFAQGQLKSPFSPILPWLNFIDFFFWVNSLILHRVKHTYSCWVLLSVCDPAALLQHGPPPNPCQKHPLIQRLLSCLYHLVSLLPSVSWGEENLPPPGS